jgi:hypothetical protein
MIMWQKLGLGKEDHGLEIHNFYNDQKNSWQKNVLKIYLKIWIIIVDDNLILKTFQII